MGQLIAEIITVTTFQQNCTLLFDDQTLKGVVVDPGGDNDRVLGHIQKLGLTIEAIWLTHGHIDHAGGAMDMRDSLDVKIIGPHKADEGMLSSLTDQATMFGLPEKVRDCVPDQWLEDGDQVAFGEHTFQVLHCPGHAPGHVAFYNEAISFVHLGDVLFRGSIGRTDLPGGDHQTLIDSIKNKILPLGDDVDFICGHGPASTIGHERQTNPFLTNA